MRFNEMKLVYFTIISTIILVIINSLNHALYHVIVEIFCIFIGIMIFVMAINSKEYSKKNVLLSIGVLYLYVGTFDFLHVVSLPEIQLLNNSDIVNQAYWVAARLAEAAGILYILYHFRKEAQSKYFTEHVSMALYTLISILIISFVVTRGNQTIESLIVLRYVFETLIVLFFLVSLYFTKKISIPKERQVWLLVAIILKSVSELTVLVYSESYEFAVLFGTITRLISYICFYHIFVSMTLKEPYQNIYSAYKKEHDELKTLSEIDQLTGIYNHSTAVHRLEDLVEKYKGTKEPLFVTMVDLDDFKGVNDTYGHQVGDQVLVGFAELLSMSNYKDRVVGRYGGDEFIIAGIFIDDMDIKERYELFASRVKEKFSKMNIEVEFSAGVVMYQDGDSVTDLIYKADIAMYEAKRLGKNRVSIWKGE